MLFGSGNLASSAAYGLVLKAWANGVSSRFLAVVPELD